MHSLVHFVILIPTIIDWRCRACDCFGYELLMAKMESLDEKLVQILNATVQLEDRLRVIEKMEHLDKKFEQLPKEPVQMENRQLETSEQNRKNIQIIDNIYQHLSSIDSCTLANASGQYLLKVLNKPLEVRCEQDLHDGGWIVIQNRFDGSVDFYRNWTEYQNGFGSMDGEFWLGLENIYRLTTSRNYELLVHMENFEGVVKYARYKKFAIGSEKEKYMLKTLETHSGTTGDSLWYSKGHKFTTYDKDNDSRVYENSAERYNGAWWYGDGSLSNLNGRYQNTDHHQVMYWWSFGKHSGLKISKLMIKEI